MPSAHAARRSAILTLVAALPLFAACGGSSNNKPKATPTATHSQAPTTTATQEATSSATAVTTATFTVSVPTTTATGVPPTATATNIATATATNIATASATKIATATATVPPTATATATNVLPTATLTTIATFTATATGVPTGTASATVTPTATVTGLPTGTTSATVSPTPTPTSTPLSAAGVAHGSVGEVYVTDAQPGTGLNLIGPDSSVVQSGTADAKGSLIFRTTALDPDVPLPVGDGYTVVAASDPSAVSGPVTVTAWDVPPDPSLYQDQVIGKGYGYLKTRDGTLISIMVYLPGAIDKGPYPTVIEYSGYDPANPDSPQPSTQITSAIGYAAVGVNIRGTGCSGGAYNYFEQLQSTDGYDVIETIAAQKWVLHNQVGMVGISFPGISQLFVAQLQPPHLAAIAPLSVISDTGRGTLYPGGILNDGFAVSWAADRQHDAMPYPGGQAWSIKRINNGDQVCLDNQKLRLQAPDIMGQIEANPYYVPAIADPLTPSTFVHNITAPVFLAGAWQDEQVGGYFGTMLDRFTSTNKVHFTVVNGNHTEPLIPAIFGRWLEFLSFYVRKEIPQTKPIDQVAMDVVGGTIFTRDPPLPVDLFALPDDRFTDASSYDEALAMYEAEPHVRVLFDDGAGSDQPGAPISSFEHSFPSWPVVPYDAGTAWYFADGGALVSDPPTVDSADPVDSFAYDSSNSQTTTFNGSNGDDIWGALPPWDWQKLANGKAVAYATAPLANDTVMVGSGSVDLWFQATTPDVDLQVTLSEIRPDGQEVYVQNGWGRASFRKLDEMQSTELRPVASGLQKDLEPLPAGQYVLGRAELFPFGHAFRKDSRIRLSVEAPGGDRPLWQFQALDVQATVNIAHSVAHPSRVVLPVVPGIDAQGHPLPPCPSLRGQPCRTYVELTKTP